MCWAPGSPLPLPAAHSLPAAHLSNPAGHPSPSPGTGTRAGEHGRGTLWRAPAHHSESWRGGEKRRETLGAWPGSPVPAPHPRRHLGVPPASLRLAGCSASPWGSGNRTSVAVGPPSAHPACPTGSEGCCTLLCCVALSGLGCPRPDRTPSTTPAGAPLLTPHPPGLGH